MFPLTAKGVETRRSGKVLVGPVDLTLDGQGTTVLLGPNGAGKTSLLRLLHGTARVTAGSLDWACPVEDARARQAFVFQRPVMLRRTVLENIAYPLRVRGVAGKDATRQAQDWAGRVGLGDLTGQAAHVLSGGEQQKLALARAMITRPDVLFLDEPTAALDGRSTREIEMILQDAKTNGTCLILSTHDLGQARRLADQVLFLLHGRVREVTPKAAFFETPQTPQAQAFLRGDIVE